MECTILGVSVISTICFIAGIVTGLFLTTVMKLIEKIID